MAVCPPSVWSPVKDDDLMIQPLSRAWEGDGVGVHSVYFC